MARSIVYNGHSSVVPIFDASQNGFIPIVRIKEEPSDEENDEEYVSFTARNPHNLRSKHSASKQYWDGSDEELIPKRLTRRSAAAIEALTRVSDDRGNSEGTDYDKKLSKQAPTSKTRKNVDKSAHTTSKSSSYSTLECKICYGRFSELYQLKKHMSYYTPASLRCRKCNINFGDVYKLMHHRETVHGQVDSSKKKKFQCDFCNQLLVSKRNLQQHIHHYHKDELTNNSRLPNNKNQRQEKVIPASSQLNTSNSSIRHDRAAKRKRTQSCSFLENGPIIPEHSINTRLNSERRSLFGMKADSHENVTPTPLLDKSQLSSSNLPKKSIPSIKSPGISSHPPLVQIYAIPNEVEALLSDCDDIPAKRMKLQLLSNKNSDNGTKIDYNSKKSSSATPVKVYDSSRTLTRSILTLKENFNCLDCSVKLEKLKTSSEPLKNVLDKTLNMSKSTEKSFVKSPEKPLENLTNKPLEKSLEKSPQKLLNDNTSLPSIELAQVSSPTSNSRSTSPTVGGTIGIELENLDIALKKLEKPKSILKSIPTTKDSSSSIFPSEDINKEPSSSAAPIEVSEKEKKTEENNGDKLRTKTKSIYLSSICRTRFTTQKKLIYHYLYYHSFPNYICAVCRTECSRLGELKKHLAVHCIPIPKSLDDRSPIDLKGPCENTKKKFMCKGCKKYFSTLVCLEEHTGQCVILEAKREKKRHSRTHEAPVVDDQHVLENPVVNQNVETPVLLQPSPAENTCNEVENTSSEVNYPPPPAPPALPVLIASKNKNSLHLVGSLPNMDKWSQYTHSDVPRQKNCNNAYFQHHCKVCNSRFQSVDNLNDHLKKFEPKNMTQCNKCGTHFPSIGLLSAHKKAAHSIDAMTYRMYCLICDQGFSKKKNLRHHTMHIHCAELMVYNKSPILDVEYEMTCRICYVAFKTRKKFIEHSMYYYNDRIVTCDVCSEEFYGQYKAHAHIHQVHFKEFYTSYTHSCKVCQDRFEHESHLQSHIFHIHKDRIVNTQCKNQHQQRQCFVCMVCNECFYTPKLLKEHKIEFSTNGTYPCSFCDRRCETLRLVEEHKKRCHYDHVPHLKKCNLCSEFVPPKLWLAHFKHFHQNVPPLELYTKNYTESKQYHQEPNIITTWFPPEQYVENVIEYTCAICDMKFKSDNELKQHRKIHKYNNPSLSSPQQKDDSENHDLLPFAFVNQDSFESEPPIVAYESDDDTKYNFGIANICSVELKEYDSLYNPDTTNKEVHSVSDNYNHCDACHYNRKIEYSDHTYQKMKRHDGTCIEALTTRNVKQTSLPNVHREFPASNQPELIVKSKETAEVLQKISTSSAQSSLVSDPQSPQKKPLGTCKRQTTINQYFLKSPAEKNISALCDICGLVFEKSSELIRHKNNDHSDAESSQTHSSMKTQNLSTRNVNTSLSSPFKDPSINQKSPPQAYIITICDEKDNDDTPVINNHTDILTRPQQINSFQKSSSLSSPSMDNNQFQRLPLADSGILYSYLHKTVN